MNQRIHVILRKSIYRLEVCLQITLHPPSTNSQTTRSASKRSHTPSILQISRTHIYINVKMLTNIKSVAILFASTLLRPTLAAPSSALEPPTAAPGASCTYRPNLRAAQFDVILYGSGKENPGTCQGGFLDNLRGQCGSDLQDWTCSSNGIDATVAFKTYGGPGCVQNAIVCKSPEYFSFLSHASHVSIPLLNVSELPKNSKRLLKLAKRLVVS
jgi:hypothetical protein